MRALLFIPVIAGVLFTGAACAGAVPSAVSTTPATTTPATSEKASAEAGTAIGTKPAPKPFNPGVHNVLLRGYDTATRIARVEPVKLGSGEKFCAENDVSPKDCAPDLVVVPSGTTYKLDVDPGVRVFSTQGGDPKCMGKAQEPFVIPGECLNGSAEDLPKSVGRLVQVAFNDKALYEVAELYRP